MKNPLYILPIIVFATTVHAGKSVEDCESELGDAAKDRKLVAACLYESIGGGLLPPPSPTNPNAFVLDLGIYDVNSAGGVEPFVDLTNPNKKSSIKYARMSVTLYNSVGDAVASSIGGGTTKSISYTGPLAYEDGTQRAQWNPVWYNYSGSCMVLQSLSIEFMNGQRASYSGKQLRGVLAPSVKNSCKVK